jgi:thymidylate synthase ThyX
MTSAYRDLYLKTCNDLFDTYSQLIPPLTELMERKFQREHDVSKVAYTAALRAKVSDCLRGLLPASALTNMGVFGNGRFFETLIQKLNGHTLAEMQDVGRKSFDELSKVIPSFVRRSESSHKHQKSYLQFQEQMASELFLFAKDKMDDVGKMENPGLRLINYDPDSPYKVAAALLFPLSVWPS